MYVEKEYRWRGMKCKVVCQEFGYRCGYVGVRPNSVLFLRSVDGCDFTSARPASDTVDAMVDGLNVHGGITYTGALEALTDDTPESFRWWFFGFDCHHAGDMVDENIIQEHRNRNLINDSRYNTQMSFARSQHASFGHSHGHSFGLNFVFVRTLDFCINQCNHLAQQIWAIEETFAREVIESEAYGAWRRRSLLQEYDAVMVRAVQEHSVINHIES